MFLAFSIPCILLLSPENERTLTDVNILAKIDAKMRLRKWFNHPGSF